MLQELFFHLQANSELIRKSWWVYILILLICTLFVYIANIVKKQDSNQLVSLTNFREEFDRPLTYFIGVIIGLINLAIAYIYPGPIDLKPPRLTTLVVNALYKLGGNYAEYFFWLLFTIVFLWLGIRKYLEKRNTCF